MLNARDNDDRFGNLDHCTPRTGRGVRPPDCYPVHPGQLELVLFLQGFQGGVHGEPVLGRVHRALLDVVACEQVVLEITGTLVAAKTRMKTLRRYINVKNTYVELQYGQKCVIPVCCSRWWRAQDD